jgi:UDP-N-acetylmuramoyl-tripeptide--D-alanyl-D-alanine ligase
MVRLYDLLGATGGVTLVRGAEDFSQVVIDSREATVGGLFFALPGEGRDGHEFVLDAARRGAAGAVVARPVDGVPDGFTVVRVPDTMAALRDLGRSRRRASEAVVVAVTGSAGKTTTKNMITHVLGSRHPVLGSRGSFNNHLGVPLTLSAIEPEHEFAVAEIGTNGRGEIDALSALVEPDIGVITNVGFAHIGNFADQRELALEKTDLLRRVGPNGHWVLNGDDELLVATAGAGSAALTRVGFHRDNDVRAVDVTVDERGSRGSIVVGGQPLPFTLEVAGRHFVRAALLAVAVARIAGYSAREAVDALAGFTAPAGRASLLRLGPELLVLDDSYNASPDATLAGLDLLGCLGAERRAAVIGEMRELGSESARLHRLVGEKAAEVATDLITVGPATAELRAAAVERGLDPGRVWEADSAREAFLSTKKVVENAAGTIAVLVKGARFTHMERVQLGLAGHLIGCGLDICHLYIHCSACPRLETGEPAVAGGG